MSLHEQHEHGSPLIEHRLHQTRSPECSSPTGKIPALITLTPTYLPGRPLWTTCKIGDASQIRRPIDWDIRIHQVRYFNRPSILIPAALDLHVALTCQHGTVCRCKCLPHSEWNAPLLAKGPNSTERLRYSEVLQIVPLHVPAHR
jgi:hypothetical protein